MTSTHSENDSIQNGCSWGYILRIAKQHRRRLIQANIIAIIASLCSIPVPLLMPLLVDEILLQKPATLVAIVHGITPATWHSAILVISVILLFTLLLRILSLALNVLQARQFVIVAKEITFRIRKAVLLQLERISMTEYETLGSGTVASRLVTDVETIDQFIGTTISRFLVAILTLTGVACILLWMHWQIALLLLLINPAVIYFTMLFGKNVKQLKKNENSAFELFQQSLNETLAGIHQIRASNREKHYLDRLVEQAAQVRSHGIAWAWKCDAANRLSFSVFLLGFDLFRAVAMGMVLLSDLSIGQMFAVFGYLWFMMAPVQEILNIQYAFYSAQAALQRLNELLQCQQEVLPTLHEDPFSGQDTVGITVCNLHFSYHTGAKVLTDISLQVKPQQKVALVGTSGAGKSTLVQLLIGLYRGYQGEILYNGVPASHIDITTLRENVGVVLQQPVLFNSTIRQNLCLGRIHAEHELWQALEVAQLGTTVRALDEQLDTLIGRSGLRLSGGQRQRLAIARMVLSQPRVVILDEATSALDAETEYLLYTALCKTLRDCTMIIVAHRLSAIKQADLIYVFADGKICEYGDSRKLLNSNGLYSRLYSIYQQQTTAQSNYA